MSVPSAEKRTGFSKKPVLIRLSGESVEVADIEDELWRPPSGSTADRIEKKRFLTRLAKRRNGGQSLWQERMGSRNGLPPAQSRINQTVVSQEVRRQSHDFQCTPSTEKYKRATSSPRSCTSGKQSQEGIRNSVSPPREAHGRHTKQATSPAQRRFGQDLRSSSNAAPAASPNMDPASSPASLAPPSSLKTKRKRDGKQSIWEKILEDVRNNVSPDKLDLRSHSLCEKAQVVALCNALALNTSSTRLDLQSCQIGDQGVEVLVESLLLAQKSSLAWIDLALNNIQDRGAKLLIKAIKAVTPLEYLDLKDNFISQKKQDKLTKVSRNYPSIKKVDLARNSSSSRGARGDKRGVHDGEVDSDSSESSDSPGGDTNNSSQQDPGMNDSPSQDDLSFQEGRIYTSGSGEDEPNEEPLDLGNGSGQKTAANRKHKQKRNKKGSMVERSERGVQSGRRAQNERDPIDDDDEPMFAVRREVQQSDLESNNEDSMLMFEDHAERRETNKRSRSPESSEDSGDSFIDDSNGENDAHSSAEEDSSQRRTRPDRNETSKRRRHGNSDSRSKRPKNSSGRRKGGGSKIGHEDCTSERREIGEFVKRSASALSDSTMHRNQRKSEGSVLMDGHRREQGKPREGGKKVRQQPQSSGRGDEYIDVFDRHSGDVNTWSREMREADEADAMADYQAQSSRSDVDYEEEDSESLERTDKRRENTDKSRRGAGISHAARGAELRGALRSNTLLWLRDTQRGNSNRSAHRRVHADSNARQRVVDDKGSSDECEGRQVGFYPDESADVDGAHRPPFDVGGARPHALLPRDMPVDVLVKGCLTLCRWELPEHCMCDTECALLGKLLDRDVVRVNIDFVERSMYKCKQIIEKVITTGECECSIQCVLAWLRHITSMLKLPSANCQLFIAVLDGLKSILVDNGYLGGHISNQTWSLMYTNFITASLHWVFYIAKRQEQQQHVGNASVDSERGAALFKEFAPLVHSKRVLAMLLYMLDKQPSEAFSLVSCIRAKSQNALQEHAHAQPQADSVIQMWAELISLLQTDDKSRCIYWEVLQATLKQTTRPYDVMATRETFSLPSLYLDAPSPAPLSRSNAQTAIKSCDKVQTSEFTWMSIIFSAVLTRAKGLALPIELLQVLEYCMRMSPLCADVSTGMHGLDAKLFISDRMAKCYELLVLERFSVLLQCMSRSLGLAGDVQLAAVHGQGGGTNRGHVKCNTGSGGLQQGGLDGMEGGGSSGGNAGGALVQALLLQLWKTVLARCCGESAARRRDNILVCTPEDFGVLGVEGKGFDFALEKRRIEGQKVCVGVLHLIATFVQCGLRGNKESSIAKFASQLCNTIPCGVLVCFVNPVRRPDGDSQKQIAKLANAVCMLILILRLSVGEQLLQIQPLNVQSDTRTINCWNDTWQKLIKLANLTGDGSGWMLSENITDSSDVKREITLRTIFMHAVAWFLREAAGKGYSNHVAECAKVLVQILDSASEELGQALTATAVKVTRVQESNIAMCEDFLVLVLRTLRGLVEEQGRTLLCNGCHVLLDQKSLARMLTHIWLKKRGKCFIATLELIASVCDVALKNAGGEGGLEAAASSLSKWAWPALQSYVLGLIKDSTEARPDMYFLPEVTSCCAKLFCAVKPYAHEARTVTKILDAFSCTNIQLMIRKAYRILPVAFHAEVVARVPEFDFWSHDCATVLNAWLHAMLDSTGHELRTRGMRRASGACAQRQVTKRLCAARNWEGEALMKQVWDAMEGTSMLQSEAALKTLWDQHAPKCDYARRAAALWQFADNATHNEVPPGAFKNLCKFIGKRIADLGGALVGVQWINTGSQSSQRVQMSVWAQKRLEMYTLFCYVVMRKLIPACAKAMQACEHGCNRTVFHTLCKMFLRKPELHVHESSLLRHQRHLLVRPLLVAVSKLNFATGMGYAKISKIARECLRLKMEDDCSMYDPDAVKVSSISLRPRLLFEGCCLSHGIGQCHNSSGSRACMSSLAPACSSSASASDMRGVVQLALHWLAMDMIVDATHIGHGSVTRASHAAFVIRDIASDVYLGTSPCHQIDNAHMMLDDIEVIFIFVARTLVHGDANVCSAVFKMLTGIYEGARRAGIPYNDILKCTSQRNTQGRCAFRARFIQYLQVEALLLAADAVFKLAPAGDAAWGTPNRKAALEALETLVKARNELKHALDEEECWGGSYAREAVESAYWSKHRAVTPDMPWSCNAMTLVELNELPARWRLVGDALALARVLLRATNASWIEFLRYLPDAHIAICAALDAQYAGGPEFTLCVSECMAAWKGFLQDLPGGCGDAYLTGMRDQTHDAQDRLEEEVFWMDNPRKMLGRMARF